jgi:hypothetical protein
MIIIDENYPGVVKTEYGFQLESISEYDSVEIRMKLRVEKSIYVKGSLECGEWRSVNGKITSKWISINLEYYVQIQDGFIKIDCQIHSISSWKNLTEDKARLMDGKKAITFFNKRLKFVLSVAESFGCDV